MYVCLIKYPKTKKNYLFDCTELCNKIKKGMKVICKDESGERKGTVISSVVYIDNSNIENEIQEMFCNVGACLPLKQIIRTGYVDVKLNDIKITKQFKRTSPSSLKIENCMNYYKANNRFDKPIILNSKGYLIDGYVRYLTVKSSLERRVQQKEQSHKN